jgi:DNA-binding response OmpR family regulator
LQNPRYEQFATEIADIKRIVRANHNLAVVGVPKVGVRNCLGLVAEDLKSDFAYVISEQDLEQGLANLGQYIQTGKVLIALPNYRLLSAQQRQEFQKAVMFHASKNIYTLIGLHYSQYLNLTEEFSLSYKPVCTTYILKPRNKQQLAALVNEVSARNISSKEQTYIFELTGGIPGLMRKVINHSNVTGRISAQVSDAATQQALDELEACYQALSPAEHIAFGLTDKSGKLLSKLLAQQVTGASESDGAVESVLKLMRQHKNQVVVFEQLDKVIAAHGTDSLWNRYKIIERVRKALKPNEDIENARGRGYKLVVK